MYRQAIEELKKWKGNPGKKPLIIRGARQVGKTWLMREFGEKHYQNVVYINFDDNKLMSELFAQDLDVRRLISGIEMVYQTRIQPENTLLIFDELQETPKALTSLKYFNENAPEYQILCAGSLLGVALHYGTSFPVGKVEFLDLHPLNFTEFLIAFGNEQYVNALQNGDFQMVTALKSKYIEQLKHYYYIGGMPEVVADFIKNQNFMAVREIQKRILNAYELDFSKHAPNEQVPRIRMMWNNIPSQLTRENKKFVYGQIREGARAKDYELALLWLSDCGLIHKVHRVTKPDMPLLAYADMKAFKLFLLDVGLLSCITGLEPKTLISGNAVFMEFKGALTEQYVLQQLKCMKNLPVYYWTNDSGNAEIDFVIQHDGNIVPIEVKAEVNLQSKSLKTYREKFSPSVSVRTSMADYKKEDWLINLPLYAINELKENL